MKKSIGYLFKALLGGYIVTGIMLVIVSVLVYYLSLSEGQINIGIWVTYIVANGIAGYIFANRINKRRFFLGVLCGTVYFLILFIASLAVKCEMGSLIESIKVLLMCIMGAIMGSIL